MGWVLPDRAAAILARSHGVRGELVASVNGSPFVIDLNLRPGGTVAVDGKSAARRKLTCAVEAAVGSPTVSPLGAEARAFYVLVDDPSGAEYRVPVGTFVLTDADEASPGVVNLKGEDRWKRVTDARFERPRTTSGSIVSTLRTLLLEADPRITVEVDPAVVDSGHGPSVWDRDRDKAVTELARAIGARVWFDPMGVARVTPAPSLGAPPYWQIGRGIGGARIAGSRGVTRSDTYNGVVVIGDPGGDMPPVYGVAYDLDPASPTRWGGPFGKRPRFYRSSLITTQQQAQRAAEAMLGRVLGVTHRVQVQALAHPGMDADDVLNVELEPGVYRRHLVGGFTLPLGIGSVAIDAVTGTTTEDEGE